MASVFVESGIEFDFTKALFVKEHDKPLSPTSDGNTIFGGVDFRIEDAQGLLWIEVKSWHLSRFSSKDRGGQTRSFLAKMQSKSLPLTIRSKFLGTTAFYAWNAIPLPEKLRFVILLEPPRSQDMALMVAFQDRMRSKMNPPRSWRLKLTLNVVTLAGWNLYFSDYPAHLL